MLGHPGGPFVGGLVQVVVSTVARFASLLDHRDTGIARLPWHGLLDHRRAGNSLDSMTVIEQRLLLVHAHPDDESINNGATMAKYAAEGRGVTLVTCTLGEEGEVLAPDLVHLAADADDTLGRYRIEELAAAMKALGVTDHRFLGGPGRYRDSGMEWDETGHARPKATVRDDTFWKADLTEAADHLVAVIREVRPQVMVTYDEFGNYGHPDHIQAHRVAMYAAQLAAVPSYRLDLREPWEIAKIYWNTMSSSRMKRGAERLAEMGVANPFEDMDPDNHRLFSPDDAIACAVDGTAYVDQKMAALKAHATQITTDGPFFALSNNVGGEAWGIEEYRIAKGVKGPVDERGWETDLFAGL
jgi:N-acetyl-1-D-myo-inositol-2-amino-2-deoxy-alpha-D-glucopyranoside deacetylase